MGRLRRRVVYQAVRRALVTIGMATGFRVVHMSIQHNHLHLLITTPRQARNALAYVLNNWRRHREDQVSPATFTASLDAYSTAFHFDGWMTGEVVARPRAELMLPSAAPRTWLVRVGWRVHGAISPTDIPGPAGR